MSKTPNFAMNFDLNGRFRFVKLPMRVLGGLMTGNVSHAAVSLAAVIEYHRFDTRKRAFPGTRRLQKMARIADWRTFDKARQELKECGLRWEKRGFRGALEYWWE